MWLFTRYGFFSAVEALKGGRAGSRPDPRRVVVRARLKRHLVNLADRFGAFGPADITRNDTSDYRYRVVLDKKVWAAVCLKLAEDITYDNFKSACKHDLPDDHEYHDALGRVWGVGYGLQMKAEERRTAPPALKDSRRPMREV